ncbi:hypothetical protein PPROV_000182000 [Pycnococcus provasolii]|uniref:Uncharacterized protein n=1 Tax=Pycnococcus provasolii TaxID=41880 RepID=A0A830H7U7_9CHLO|nr:hypothetical protein PPROV_000182000 [Pycnococcus provasolii]
MLVGLWDGVKKPPRPANGATDEHRTPQLNGIAGDKVTIITLAHHWFGYHGEDLEEIVQRALYKEPGAVPSQEEDYCSTTSCNPPTFDGVAVWCCSYHADDAGRQSFTRIVASHEDVLEDVAGYYYLGTAGRPDPPDRRLWKREVEAGTRDECHAFATKVTAEGRFTYHDDQELEQALIATTNFDDETATQIVACALDEPALESTRLAVMSSETSFVIVSD